MRGGRGGCYSRQRSEWRAGMVAGMWCSPLGTALGQPVLQTLWHSNRQPRAAAGCSTACNAARC